MLPPGLVEVEPEGGINRRVEVEALLQYLGDLILLPTYW